MPHPSAVGARRGRSPMPRYRAQRGSWYVCIDGRRVFLGRDEEGAYRKFREIMAKLGRDYRPPEDRLQIPATNRHGEECRQVYFIRNTGTGHIKIGISANSEVRLGQLQMATSETLELIGFFLAVPNCERMLQNWFRRFWVRGEWFRPEEPLLRAIEQLLAGESMVLVMCENYEALARCQGGVGLDQQAEPARAAGEGRGT